MTVHVLLGALREALRDPALRIEEAQPVGGGCIHHAARLVTSRGDLFAKWNEDCAPDVFLSEAEGLRALRAAGSPLVVPEVLAAAAPKGERPAFIVMEYLKHSRGAMGEAALGRGLAALHGKEAAAFGFPVRTYCGSTPQDNTQAPTWVEFYAVRRLQAMERLLDEKGKLNAADRRALARLRERLPDLLPHAPAASLIHGDLWSGNVLMSDRGPALVDPSCAHADREMEFGITTLFGGFGSRFFAAYEEVAPLPAGWPERNPLYQLYHLLNHFLIFGGHYGAEARSLLRRYV